MIDSCSGGYPELLRVRFSSGLSSCGRKMVSNFFDASRRSGPMCATAGALTWIDCWTRRAQSSRLYADREGKDNQQTCLRQQSSFARR